MHYKPKVSLQINLSPSDYPSARFILPHQLNVLAPQVDEILLTIESKPSKGRFATAWTENEAKLKAFLNDISDRYPVKILYVDYTGETKKKVAEYFFKGNYIPEKDFRGGPFYCYFFGLYHCSHDLVFHLDADMFLGGRSPLWVQEAAALFSEKENLFCLAPLPGPPAKNEKLVGQTILKKFDDQAYKFQLAGFSTRIFMIKKSSVHQHKLRLTKPGLKNQLKAILKGNVNADLPEHQLADFMENNGLIRIDFLGSGDGMWSLHPPYRNSNFYDGLENLIKKIENNDVPDSQKGFYDITDELIDWSDARMKLEQDNRILGFLRLK